MFESAIERVAQFTRPLKTITRNYGGLVVPGSSTFFFVNNNGVAVTCKHVAVMINDAEKINKHFIEFKREREKFSQQGNLQKYIKGLELKYQYRKEITVQMKHNFPDCIDKLDAITCHLHPTLDLAIIEFKGFNKLLYQSHAVFVKDSAKVKQGKYLCRIGFPFPEFNNFVHDAATDDIAFTNEGMQQCPLFPLDGIITRFVADKINDMYAIEMSTPGLRGQSGGPLFDADGKIYGMQFATNHLHLGFDITDKEIISDGKKSKVSNYPFLHTGLSIHVNRIKEFLLLHNIEFAEE